MPPAAPATTIDEPALGIEAHGVTKSFKGQLALPPIDLEAPRGAVTLLTGRNGAGKTTFLRIMATLVTRDGGYLTVDGLDPSIQGRALRHRVGLALVNERSVYWRLTTIENLMLVAKIRGIAKADRRAAVDEAVESVGLSPMAAKPIHDLSAGQRQRVVLARALLGNPSVLLIDEPLRGLDDEATALVLQTLNGHAQRGATVLVASPTAQDFAELPSARAVVPDRPDVVA